MATLNQLRDGYNRLNGRLIRGAGTLAKTAFEGLGSWRESDIERFFRIIGPQLDGVKRQVARLQETYYQQVALNAEQPHVKVPTPSENLSTESLRNGVPFEEVYRRPFASMYTALSENSLVSAAIGAGALRAAQIASTDAQLASRAAGAAQRSGNANIKFYRRTLTGMENCALCAVASTQRYKRGNLKPIHPGCDCGEEPFYGSEDTPQVIDEQKLFDTHEALFEQLGVDDPSARDAGLNKIIESGEGAKLADFTEIIVESNHGEYGPTLSFRDQNFTTLNDIEG